MDNLRCSIELIFQKCPADEVLKGLGNLSENFSDALFQRLALSSDRGFSLNDYRNLKAKLDEDWFLDAYQINKKQRSIFNLLIHFNKQVLIETENEPFIHYEHLLRWRQLSFCLGEDLFTTSYLAFMDYHSQRKRSLFAWRSILFSNNLRLKEILNEGMAENHFHLKGSAPVFDLSWLSLMNNITGRQATFEKMKQGINLNSHATHSFESDYSDVETLTYKAAFIRQHLFKVLHEIKIEDFEKDLCKSLKYHSNSNDSFLFSLKLEKINCEIETLKYTQGHKLGYKDQQVVADYAIPKSLHADNQKGCFLLTGERKFLYDCFFKIYSNDHKFKPYRDFFYAYLLIKNKLRAELIQVNSKIGFGNFLKYQDRKEEFIQSGTVYEAAFLKMAVEDSLKFQKIKWFETRIAPKENALDLQKSLSKINAVLFEDTISFNLSYPSVEAFLNFKVLEPNQKMQHFYVLHFIKEPDDYFEKNKNNDILNANVPRHFYLRQKIKAQANAIVNLRESAAKTADSIRGIDAAASEFDSRPEVFAQAFRYLKDHKLKGNYGHFKKDVKEIKLYATFHAGEDFYDIIDGLRCIDEAILYLNLTQGDRIGHALALGIDARHYFETKGKKIMIPAEILLDNIVWILAKVRKYSIQSCQSEVYRLEKLFDSLFAEIYLPNFKEGNHNFNHNTFYDAWKLRGDDPLLYLGQYQKDIELFPNLTYWERCRINRLYPKNNNIRANNKVKFLYHEYHFNPGIKKNGKKIKQFNISQDYIELVTQLQQCYMHAIKNRNIGIECNPTSNYHIGTFKRYANHPIVRFYNLGLNLDTKTFKNCPQLFVSINTDDQGIFSTSLENEFALMAIALEKEKDEMGNPKYNQAMIYSWLDNIRRMGIQQSFGDKNFK